MTGVELLWLDLHLRAAHSSALETLVERPVVVMRIATQFGDAWGECAALQAPTYDAEYAEGAWDVLRRFLVPALVDRARTIDGSLPPPADVDRLGGVRGHSMAKACVEMALLDAVHRADGNSLAGELGVVKEQVAAGAVLGLGHQGTAADHAIVSETARLVAEGYKRVKVKIAPGRGLETLRVMRREFPELAIQADANGTFDLDLAEHVRELDAIDDLDLLMLEQPLEPDELVGHADLVERLRTPICLDESLTSVRRIGEAIGLGACDVVCIKPARLGGIIQAVIAQGVCREVGVAAWCGGMLETALARSANAALSALPGFTLPGDVTGGERFVESDPFLAGSDEDSPRTASPVVDLHRSPGVGPAPDEDLLRAVTTRSEYFAL
jgi:O-succinylbenzoate synthase